MAKKAAKTEAEAATSTKNAPDHARAPKSPNETEAKTATEIEAKTVIEIETATGTAKNAAEAETATGEGVEVEPGRVHDPEAEGETIAEKDTEPDLDRETDAIKPHPNARKRPSSHPKIEIRGLCFVCN